MGVLKQDLCKYANIFTTQNQTIYYSVSYLLTYCFLPKPEQNLPKFKVWMHFSLYCGKPKTLYFSTTVIFFNNPKFQQYYKSFVIFNATYHIKLYLIVCKKAMPQKSFQVCTTTVPITCFYFLSEMFCASRHKYTVG